jgi:hypothetical protein
VCRQTEGEQQDRESEQETGVERVGSGQAAWQENSRVQAAEERVVCRKLSELAEFTCPYCWGIVYEVFGREESVERREEEAQAEHRIWECPRLATRGGVERIDRVRQWVQYSREVKVCWKCGIAEDLCRQERDKEAQREQAGEEGQGRCMWGQVVMGVVYGLREAGRAKAQLGGKEAYRETVLGQAGYIDRGGDSSESSRRESNRRFGKWLGERCRERQVGGRVVSKGMAVVVEAIL